MWVDERKRKGDSDCIAIEGFQGGNLSLDAEHERGSRGYEKYRHQADVCHDNDEKVTWHITGENNCFSIVGELCTMDKSGQNFKNISKE